MSNDKKLQFCKSMLLMLKDIKLSLNKEVSENSKAKIKTCLHKARYMIQQQELVFSSDDNLFLELNKIIDALEYQVSNKTFYI